MALRRTLINGGRETLYRTNKITPTITRSTVEGRDAQGNILPGWFETYCVPGSSVRTILPNGYSTCPMYYRGVTETTMDRAMAELMGEPLPTKPAPPTMQIQSCPPSCPEGYSAITGKLLPGWIQPQCIRAPCPAMFVGDKQTEIVDIREMPAPNGETVIVGTDADGDVVVAAKKKPNWLPLALAAGAAYFFMM